MVRIKAIRARCRVRVIVRVRISSDLQQAGSYRV